jgi:hypothetical protein
LTPSEAAKSIQQQLEQSSGKPVLIDRSNELMGYSTMRIAAIDAPAHLFRYKLEFEPELPYLLGFQCGLALRTVEAKSGNRFDVSSTDALSKELPQLVLKHLRSHAPHVVDSVIPQFASQLANGLGAQIRTIPVSIRVEALLAANYPCLCSFQRKINERHLQESMAALGANIRAIAPPKVLDANLGMSAAFGKFLAREWNEPHLAAAFVSAGYGKIADDLLDLIDTIDASPDGDRQLVDAWAKTVGISDWYVTVPKV